MSAAVTRRELFARFRSGPPQLRPPWARSEAQFTDSCTRCGDCISVCPTRIITKGHAGYPIVVLAGSECTFCAECADACESGCFDRTEGRAPWQLRAAISTACVETKGIACRMCEEACAVQAIRFRPRLGGGSAPSIDTDCTGCGACVGRCPVKAISIVMPQPAEASS